MSTHLSALFAFNPLVLENRPIRADVDPARLSRFNDSRWDLTPAIFEEHSTTVSFTFDAFPERWRGALRSYLWVLINEDVRPVPGATPEGRPSVRSIALIKSSLSTLIRKLEASNITDLQQLDDDRLNDLAIDLGKTVPFAQARKILTEVRRLWSYRSLVPAPLQMPPRLPWNGDRATDLLPEPPMVTENKTARISDATLLPLMSWAMRFVEDFSGDILSSFNEYRRLIVHEYRHRPDDAGYLRLDNRRGSRSGLRKALETLRELNLGLPGRKLADGRFTLHLSHLGRLAGANPQWLALNHFDILEEFDLPIDDDAYLTVPCTGQLEGSAWRPKPLSWSETPLFATRLQTACFLVISYLSGMRPGEVLSLRRGCLDFDEASGLWTVTGTRWKSVRMESGEKNPNGETRAVPWVIHPIAAQAIEILHSMHSGDLLFPVKVRPQPVRGIQPAGNLRSGAARTSSQIGTDLAEFISWVNYYVAGNGRRDVIPEDPHGRINPRRLRRTLAWHIVRRPRGLVAAAIQYGHVATYITQGYAGSYSSGFPDDLAFERWLARYEELSELDRYAVEGGRVSGPAADELRSRAAGTRAKFGGRTLPTHRQATALLQDPLLQVYPGDGMHCVFDATTAMCSRDSHGPVMSACQSSCSNIARTDSDVEGLIRVADRLRADSLAPPIRHARALSVIASLEKTIVEHHAGSQTP